MAQILDPLAQEYSQAALCCCYINHTSKVQIARITNVPNWYFERVVFPGQRLMFEAPGSAQLEIHTGMMASSILSDSIACSKLEIGESDGAISLGVEVAIAQPEAETSAPKAAA
ncbi:MAG: DUF1830 domain-containing protein [Synechococcales cyanobacterium RM1_1_8]|nr:DUF1830 domain-containing protein [Synechococcales cyanobacterium RM1_1_8]